MHEIDSCGFGLLVDINNQKSNTIVKTALLALARLSHRGAVGEDGLSGDGCGIMLQLDHNFFKQLSAAEGIMLKNNFAVGMCFLNNNNLEVNKSAIEHAVKQLGCHIAGWRTVPINLQFVGSSNQKAIPIITQVFIEYPETWSINQIEKNLYQIKILASHAQQEDKVFYICSLSSQTIIYKALVLTQNLALFYTDLQNNQLQSAVALVHQRFSTNTLSSWSLAQPFSTLAHNGEINTIQGNRHYATQLSSRLIKEHYPELRNIPCLVNSKGSDSESMDNLLEAFIHANLTSHEALRLMIPPAWENAKNMTYDEKDYFNYHAPLLPSWEGPAGIIFFDGRYAGCILDKNGFRPARLVKSDQGWIGIGSEIGIFNFNDQKTTLLSRIKPGELFVIDTKQQAIKQENYQKTFPYSKWLAEYRITLPDTESDNILKNDLPLSNRIQKHFDVSGDEKTDILRYIAENGIEPTASMGDDAPIAALSLKPRQLFDFFRQQFAQVTNPPIDSLREKSVMSLQVYLGTQGLITQRQAILARQIALNTPLLMHSQLIYLQSFSQFNYHSIELSLGYSPKLSLKQAIDNLLPKVKPLSKTHLLIILSDEKIKNNQCTIHPSLAVGALHHHLISLQQRGQVSLIVNSGWVREAHHLAMLIACGADAVYPWLAYQLVIELALKNQNPPLESLQNFRLAINKGLLKICSKMGVCTVNSYKGSQLFHIIGLHRDIIESCFSQCAFWFEKYDWQALDEKQKVFYYQSIDPTISTRQGGLYKYTPQGEYHDYNPDVVTSLLRAVNEQDALYYQQFKELINCREPVMVRDYLRFKKTQPIAITDVEPITDIIKRFNTAAMSLGALGPESHEALAVAMNTLGGRSNSGEGGEAQWRYASVAESKIKQIASARFGVTAEYLMHAEIIQIKIAQGAKPGEGGQLPGNKVNAMIAELRYCSPGVTLISPPPHHDIYSIEDLAQLIFDLKQVNPHAYISIKLVSAPGIGTIAAGVVKAYADMITISGYDGGTGASPLSSIRYTGCPWELGLSETQRVLIDNNLRHRVTLQVDGGLKTGLDVIKAAIMGAESFGFGTAPMVALGCKYLRICHLNNCATGIATQDERLRTLVYQGKPERVMLYFNWVAEEVREWLATLGFNSLQEIIGRVDLLEAISEGEHIQQILTQPQLNNIPNMLVRNPSFDKALLANQLLSDILPSLQNNTSFTGHYDIANHNRSIGANIAGEMALNKYKSLVDINFQGFAGQSFGAWMVDGMSFMLEGAANDYVGKGISGGQLIIKPFNGDSTYSIAGNTCLYGATGGTCYIDGLAGERFAVRNSGCTVVVVGVGNHGCEYMTAGLVLILSTPGDNFAAGMTGGMAFVYDDKQLLLTNYNPESVTLYQLNDQRLLSYQTQVMQLLVDFYQQTKSSTAAKLLENKVAFLNQCYLVLPQDILLFKESP